MAAEVRVRILNVGQGDAIVGILPGGKRAFVMDVYDADAVLDFLEAEGIAEVILFISHSDRDHAAGVKDFLAHYPQTGHVLGVLCNRDRLNATLGSDYVKLFRLIGSFTRSHGAPGCLREGFDTNLNGNQSFSELFPAPSSVRVLHPHPADLDSLVGLDINEVVGVLLVECEVGEGVWRRVLLSSDVQLTGISLMLARGDEGPVRADVLKFPHHGAWPEQWPGISFVGVPKKDLADFIRAVGPTAVVLSAGFSNAYGHVRPEVFELLRSYHAETQRLSSLKCTQFTPTCLGSPNLPPNGELSNPHCAGDVEVRMGPEVGGDGLRIVTTPEDHLQRVLLVHKAGSAQCRFLPEL